MGENSGGIIYSGIHAVICLSSKLIYIREGEKKK
jgi:hypothetical protein